MNRYLIILLISVITALSLEKSQAEDGYSEPDSYNPDIQLAPIHPATLSDQQIKYRTDILNEIERLGEELELLENIGHLAPSAKLALYGFLGTMAFGIARTELASHFVQRQIMANADLTQTDILLKSVVDYAFPSLSMGAIFGISNYFPTTLPSTNTYIDIVTTAAAITFSNFAITITFGSSGMGLTFIVNALLLIKSIYNERIALHGKRSNLKAQLKAARKSLNNHSPRES